MVRVGNTELSEPLADLGSIRGGVIGLVLQEPGSALNPVLSIGTQLTETIHCHRRQSRRQARLTAVELLGTVNLDHPGDLLGAYSHQLSGGQLQRVMLALALAGEPDLIIADEPTTALDVTTQAQVLALLHRICDEQGLSLLLISHDLAVVAATVSRLEVMYAGEIVESGPVVDLLRSPHHPYTRMLVGAASGHRTDAGAAAPPAPSAARESAVVDDRSSPGCRFARRCPLQQPTCRSEHPRLVSVEKRRLRCPIAGRSTGKCAGS
jgi:oligopeptide/dipeptide ABC transporter ATP-binding protein